MPCQKCGSERQSKFSAEINVHFPGHEGRDKASILIFPELLVCLECGFTELTISENDLPHLAMRAGKSGK
jgi:predicted nucleic-acid-binding Zn-ribbon protein